MMKINDDHVLYYLSKLSIDLNNPDDARYVKDCMGIIWSTLTFCLLLNCMHLNLADLLVFHAYLLSAEKCLSHSFSCLHTQ